MAKSSADQIVGCCCCIFFLWLVVTIGGWLTGSSVQNTEGSKLTFTKDPTLPAPLALKKWSAEQVESWLDQADISSGITDGLSTLDYADYDGAALASLLERGVTAVRDELKVSQLSAKVFHRKLAKAAEDAETWAAEVAAGGGAGGGGASGDSGTMGNAGSSSSSSSSGWWWGWKTWLVVVGLIFFVGTEANKKDAQKKRAAALSQRLNGLNEARRQHDQEVNRLRRELGEVRAEAAAAAAAGAAGGGVAAAAAAAAAAGAAAGAGEGKNNNNNNAALEARCSSLEIELVQERSLGDNVRKRLKAKDQEIVLMSDLAVARTSPELLAALGALEDLVERQGASPCKAALLKLGKAKREAVGKTNWSADIASLYGRLLKAAS